MKRLDQQAFQLKKQAVEAVIADQLLDEEAKKRGITREQLLQQEVNAKAAPVTDAEIEKIYNDNKSRLGNRTLADVKPQIQQQMQNERIQQQRQTFIRGLRKAASVKILLKAPVVEVALNNSAAMRGSANAPVTIVEFSDYQ
jgi:hypothetical protein